MGTSSFKHESSRRLVNSAGRKIVRECRSYRVFFPADVCSWCLRSLGDKPHVDHDHACCDRRDGKCCAGCVRGLVHLRCNQEIAAIDGMRARGVEITLPDHYERYMSERPLAVIFAQHPPEPKPFRAQKSCTLCHGPMQSTAQYGVCRRTRKCNAENNRLAQIASRKRRQS